MANPQHSAILNQSVATWNRWREDNPEIRPDLSGADLNQAKLAGANLSGANLIRANLVKTNLVRANLDGANLSEADMRWTCLIEANLFRANLDGVRHLTWQQVANAFIDRNTALPTEIGEQHTDEIKALIEKSRE